jgi:hypothetical protein
MIYFYLWAGRAVKTTLGRNFVGPTQRWDRAGLEGGGAGSNSRSQAPSKPPKAPQLGGKWGRRAPGGAHLAGHGEQAEPVPLHLLQETGSACSPRPATAGPPGGLPSTPTCPTCPQVGGGLGGSIRRLGGPGLGPAPPPPLAALPKFLRKLHYSCISFGDFSIFFVKFFCTSN